MRWTCLSEICHTFAETRDIPFHNYVASTSQYASTLGKGRQLKEDSRGFHVGDARGGTADVCFA